MDFFEYEDAVASTAIYPEVGQGSLTALNYTVLGMGGEAGEILNKVKKIYRDKDGVLSPEDRAEISKEIGDVLWYAARAAHELGYTLEEVAEYNVEKLRDRRARGVLAGSGDNR
jgi:NTP pyrophosphatase (non-canonical NTP hydrolase)